MNPMQRAALCLASVWMLVAVPAAYAQTVRLQVARVGSLTKSEQARFVAAHNIARKAVKVEPIRWSDELAKVALESLTEQKDRLIETAKEGWSMGRYVMPEHRQDNKYGENIAAWGGNRTQPAEWAVTLWLGEKAAFDKLNEGGAYKYGDEVGKTETDRQGRERPIIVGHYTAIVWRTTTHVGAAKLIFELADNQGLARQYVAIISNYDPPGNRPGEKPF
jgi:hypothetical protein